MSVTGLCEVCEAAQAQYGCDSYTGLWTRRFLENDPDVHVDLLDLPGVLEDAREEMEEAGMTDRVTFVERDLREPPVSFPEGMDVIWMCQLLDCFPPEGIDHLLTSARSVMDEETRLLIVELFPDRQQFDAASFCLDAISLYFACVASGNSRFYRFEQFREFVAEAGLRVETIHDVPSSEHTLLDCRRDGESPGRDE